jgi:hypothetical protein
VDVGSNSDDDDAVAKVTKTKLVEKPVMEHESDANLPIYDRVEMSDPNDHYSPAEPMPIDENMPIYDAVDPLIE